MGRMDGVALASVITSGAVGIGGIAAGYFGRRGDRREVRRVEAVSALGGAMALMARCEPARVAMFTTREQAQERLDEIRDRWEAIEQPLVAVHIAHHDAEVRRLAESLSIAIVESMSAVARHAHAVFAHGPDLRDSLTDANEARQRARDRAEELALALRK